MDYVKSFSSYLGSDRGLSPHTVSSYTNDIERFLSFTSKRFDHVTSLDVRVYVAHLNQLGRAKATIHRVISSIQSFFSYLQEIEKILTVNPAKEIKRPKKDKTLPKAVSEKVVSQLIEAASKKSLKVRLLLELLYGLGGRVSEIVSLRVEDIDRDECYVRIFGKGGKERYSPIHKGAIDLLAAYLNAHRIRSGYIFPKRGNQQGHMSRVTAWQAVKRLAVEGGIDPRHISPHVFRHSFATHMLDNGCDMALVQEYLGHEDIGTTKIYAKVTRTNKTVTFHKFHPLAR